METNDPIKYLSLKTAAQLYGYTRDHLGLMIRQNKLKGKKLGNYYVTTSDWVLEYIKNYADSSHFIARNKFSNRFVSEILSPKKEIRYVPKSKNLSQEHVLLVKRKPNDSLMGEPKTKLQEEIIKELSRSQIDEDVKMKEKSQPDIQEDTFLSLSELPYLVLPIRKMEDSERKTILNLLDRNGRGNEKEIKSI